MDRTELLRLYQTLGPVLGLYARTWLDAAGAQDAVQDVFVALFTRGETIGNPRAWLYTAVRNRAIEVSRSRRRRERRERDVGMGEALRADPASLVDWGTLALALDSLTPEEKELVVLRVWGELTFEEVAAISGMSVATAFRRFQGALGTIREKLEASCTRPKI